MSKKKKGKIHPWRLCPEGEHWVRAHPLHVPPSKKHPAGSVTIRHVHCANNPTGKDQLYPDEIQEIAKQNFSKVKNKPCPLTLPFPNGSKYDDLIAGWTQYWNDVFGPSESLDPNLIKALIASESSFNPTLLANKRDSNSARGLMQITNKTRKILENELGELKDHYLTITKNDLNDPNINISAGIRWLFQKKLLASNRLGRPATCEEAVAEYKGVLKDFVAGKTQAKKLMDRFKKYFETLKQCGKV